jgi:hypothetical protein
MEQSPREDKHLRFAATGVEFALTIGLFTAGGYWLDASLDLLPLFTLLGLGVGFAGALWRLVSQVRQADRQPPPADRDSERS